MRMSLFWKCFITFLISTFIFMCVQFYMFSETSMLWEKSYTEQIESSLNHNAAALSADLENFYYLPKIMNISNDFRTLSQEVTVYSPVHSRRISYTMNNLSDQTAFFGPMFDVIIHMQKSGICITPNYFYMALDEIKTNYRYQNLDLAEIIENKPAKNTSLEMLPCDRVIIRNARTDDYLTCLMKESADNCTYIFLIEKAKLYDYFQLDSLPDRVHFVLSDQNGNTLVENGFSGTGERRLREEFVTFTTEIPAVSATASISIPRSYFKNVTHEARQSVYVINALSLLVGLILSFVFSRINAQPIRDLIYAQHIPTEKQSKNELVTIYNYLSESKQQQRSMQEKLLSGLLTRAFSGLIVTKEEFVGIAEDSVLCAPNARIAVVRYKDTHDNQEFQSMMLFQLKENMPPEFIIEPLNRQELGLVLPAANDAVLKLKNYLEEISKDLVQSGGIICGVSMPFTGPDGISEAVQQARASLPSGGECFAVYNTNGVQSLQKAQRQNYKEFQAALANWNIKKVDALIQEFADAVMKENGAVAQEVFYTLLTFIKDAANAVNVPPELFEEYSFTRTISGDANIRKLNALTNRLFEMKAASRSDGKKNRNREIIAYINNHYDDPLMSSATVSGIYDCSERTITTILNEETGMSFAAYLTDIRMRKAGEMLRDTTLDAAAVAEKVGLTMSTFYRNFKKYYHITPAGYKARFTGENAAE